MAGIQQALTVAIDPRVADRPGMERTGIGRYAIEAANALAAARPTWRFDVFTNRPEHLAQPNQRARASRLPTSSGAARVAWLHGASLLDRRARRADAWFSPAFTLPIWARRKPAVVTVHDLVFLDHVDTYSSRVRARYAAAATRLAAARASGLVCVSRETAARVAAAFGTPTGKIRVVHNGVAERFFAADGAAAPPRDPTTVLAVGSVEPRKGLDVLHAAVGALNQGRPSAPVRLTVAGARSWGSDELRSALERDPAVDLVQSPSDEELVALYRRATVLAFASRAEGFGLPVAEAMAAGCPVVASDLPSIREFAGDVPVYVPVGDVDALAGALAAVVDDPASAAERGQQGIATAATLRWSAVGEAIAEMLQEAAA